MYLAAGGLVATKFSAALCRTRLHHEGKLSPRTTPFKLYTRHRAIVDRYFIRLQILYIVVIHAMLLLEY